MQQPWVPLPPRPNVFLAPTVEGGAPERHAVTTKDGARLLRALRRRIMDLERLRKSHEWAPGNAPDSIAIDLHRALCKAEGVEARARGARAAHSNAIPGVELNDEDAFALPDEPDQGASTLSPQEVLNAKDGANGSTFFFLPHAADVCPSAAGSSCGDAIMNLALALSFYMTDPTHPSMGIPHTFEETAERAKREAELVAQRAACGDASLDVRWRRMRVARFTITAGSLEDLVFTVLDTALRVFQEQKLVFRHGRLIEDVQLRSGDVYSVSFELAGTRFSRTRHVVGTEVKAITKHMLRVQRGDQVLAQSTETGAGASAISMEGDDAPATSHIPSASGDVALRRQRGMRATMEEFQQWYNDAVARGDEFYVQCVVDI